MRDRFVACGDACGLSNGVICSLYSDGYDGAHRSHVGNHGCDGCGGRLDCDCGGLDRCRHGGNVLVWRC